MALLRASEITLMEGRDWFEITRETADIEEKRSSGPSLSIGGGTGSYGRSSSVGVGVGIGIPLGGGGSSACLSFLLCFPPRSMYGLTKMILFDPIAGWKSFGLNLLQKLSSA